MFPPMVTDPRPAVRLRSFSGVLVIEWNEQALAEIKTLTVAVLAVQRDGRQVGS